MLRGNGLVAQNRLAEAEALLLARLSSDPIRATTAQLAAENVGDGEVASRWLRQVEASIGQPTVEQQLALAEAWLSLSSRLRTSGPRDELVRRLEQLSSRLAADSSTNAAMWFSLALLKERAGDPEGAKQDYRRSIAASPDFAVAKNNLAMLLMADAANWDEALKLAREATQNERDPNYAEFLDTLGLVELRRGEASAARQSFQRAVELNPGRLDKRLNLIEALIGVGDFEAVDSQLDEARRLATRVSAPADQMQRLAKLTADADERRPRQP
jgi:type IV pilus assembly protein PilF